MAYMLEPEDDRFLSVDNVIKKLQQEFDYVHVDVDSAIQELDIHIRFLHEQKKRGSTERNFDDEIEKCEQLKGLSASIVASDRPDYQNDYLAFLLDPEQSIFIGFCSYDHEQTSITLVERFAESLGYEIEEL